MRKMRVCCSAHILLYCRFYWLPVRFTRKNEMYNDGDNSNNNNKKAKKSPITHESSGSRLQIPRAGRNGCRTTSCNERCLLLPFYVLPLLHRS